MLSAAAPPPDLLPHYMLELRQLLGSYLLPGQIADVERAFAIGEAAHRGQMRKSGEPYITHPVAVARILAEMHLDVETIISAILHDTLEDTALTKPEIIGQFGQTVAELVDGVTKLDKVQFASKETQAAESFRKMVLAMARDLRVILIKLADRLHNMRTLGAQGSESRRRIARETLDIYAPIAQRLGMNRIRAELQDLGFQALYPLRHKVIEQRARQLFGNRRELTARIQAQIKQKLDDEHIAHRIVSRLKAPYSIYAKMRTEGRKRFGDVMDVFGIRVVVRQVMHCYVALGAVHHQFKPLDGRFKDYIAIPKANGYQSLHTVLFGPNGHPLEVQIRTEDMDVLAERGVAAHWIYKTDSAQVSGATTRAREWLGGLLDAQRTSGNSIEFLENVKVDLFPDEVYVFTPKGKILALPKNASCIDFAYAVHTDVGDHAVAARVDGQLKPLRTRLASGQKVEIIRAPSAQPRPSWLEWVVTSKARSAIRHWLKHLQHGDAVRFGNRMLNRALDDLGTSIEAIPEAHLDQFLAEQKLKGLEELLADIALGNRVPAVVARQLLRGDVVERSGASDVLRISGSERGVIAFGNCCHPIPGDPIIGYLSVGKGLVVHQTTCPNMAEMRKFPDRLVRCDWDPQVEGDYRVCLRIEVANRPGVLATVAAAIADARSNIDNVEYLERDMESAGLLFTIDVHDRNHLAEVMKRVRKAEVVLSVQRVN